MGFFLLFFFRTGDQNLQPDYTLSFIGFTKLMFTQHFLYALKSAGDHRDCGDTQGTVLHSLHLKLTEIVLLTYPGETIRENNEKYSRVYLGSREMENKLGF